MDAPEHELLQFTYLYNSWIRQ